MLHYSLFVALFFYGAYMWRPQPHLCMDYQENVHQFRDTTDPNEFELLIMWYYNVIQYYDVETVAIKACSFGDIL